MLVPVLLCCGGSLVILAGAVGWGALGAAGGIDVAVATLVARLVLRPRRGSCCELPANGTPIRHASERGASR
jgi:hypothetical protein